MNFDAIALGSYPSLNLEWMLRANRERRIERVGESHRLRINSEDGSNFVIVDQSTGLTTKSGIYAAGELFQISEFLRRREYPGGIVFPGLTVECELRSGLVKSLAVYAVEKAEFNVAVDDSDFSVAVPADVVVVRDNSTRGRKTEKLVAATSNALSDAAIFREVHSPKRFGWTSLMSLALGIGALLVAGAAWRVASRR